MKRFESKKDRWVSIVIWFSVIVMVSTAILIALEGSLLFNILMQTVNIATIYLCLGVLYQTYYVVDGETLILRSGPFIKRILIKDIIMVKMTRDVLSSPALSIDRIKIIYKQSRAGIMVSPVEKDLFLCEIGIDPETYMKITK